jgi:hypothetical protein
MNACPGAHVGMGMLVAREPGLLADAAAEVGVDVGDVRQRPAGGALVVLGDRARARETPLARQGADGDALKK